jgi:hypothetical protein
LGTLMPSAQRVHSLLKLTSYFNFEVGGVHTISIARIRLVFMSVSRFL